MKTIISWVYCHPLASAVIGLLVAALMIAHPSLLLIPALIATGTWWWTSSQLRREKREDEPFTNDFEGL